ncbi:MAG TPA: GatB/YqeY domain-containing protein, partial [bacterium]|nr:GatB/YqeY domain-containing protein [bacterium]
MSAELKSQIDSRYLEAYKQKNDKVYGLLRLLLSGIKNLEIQKKTELSDDEIQSLLKKEIKTRQESIEQYSKGGRPDLAEKEKEEIDLIKDFLPAELSRDEVDKIVQETIVKLNANSMQDMGRVIGAVMGKIGP